MANNINWGQIYCFTEFGDEDNTVAKSIPSLSSAVCFLASIVIIGQIETIAITSDDARYRVDNTELTVDKSLV